MSSLTELNGILQCFEPISLEEMESVKLMNRIDTKYVVALWKLPRLLELAKEEYYVQEIANIRIASYDTVYYDTLDLEMYLKHHNRHLVRQKIRVRQYVDSNLFFLEVKRKNNKGRTRKKRIKLSEFPKEMMSLTIEEYIRVQDFIAEKSDYVWQDISPKLRTTFKRITLVNKEKTERLTIDLNLLWKHLETNKTKTYPALVIVELKRDGNVSSPMIKIMQEMRIKPLKISKYCIGTALTTPEIKQNRFKSKIKKIEKMLNSKS